MSRPAKRKNVCMLPNYSFFSPQSDLDLIKSESETITISTEEFETIRLIDYLGLTQNDCAEHMNTARTTVQRLYNSARKKISLMLIQGYTIQIKGGNYSLCHRSQCTITKSKCSKQKHNSKRKDLDNMKIAVTYENGEIFQHFGKTKQFKIYNISDNKILSSEIMSSGENGHGALADMLSEANIDILICGGIGRGAQNALLSCGIKFFGGVTGLADAAVDAYLSDSLNYNADVHCIHSEHSCSNENGEHKCHH